MIETEAKALLDAKLLEFGDIFLPSDHFNMTVAMMHLFVVFRHRLERVLPSVDTAAIEELSCLMFQYSNRCFAKIAHHQFGKALHLLLLRPFRIPDMFLVVFFHSRLRNC